MALLRACIRAFDVLMFIYFVVHIPITILVDIQDIVGRDKYPDWARKAVDDHVRDHGDHLVGTNPLWFRSFVWGELMFQLPMFAPLALGVLKEAAWVRIPAIIYGTHVATTLIPMIAEFLFSETVKAPNYVGLAFYLPYFLLPALLVVRMWLLWSPPAAKIKIKLRAKTA